jgi:hypothetical protein
MTITTNMYVPHNFGVRAYPRPGASHAVIVLTRCGMGSLQNWRKQAILLGRPDAQAAGRQADFNEEGDVSTGYEDHCPYEQQRDGAGET